MKFHLNLETGETGLCKATLHCPFGQAEVHFASEAEARAAFEEKHEAFQKKTPPLSVAMDSLADAFQTFLTTHKAAHKRTQGEDFEDFFGEHLKQAGVREFTASALPPGAEGLKVKASLAALKALPLDATAHAPNELGSAWFMRHPFGEYQFPDYVVATAQATMAVEMKSSNQFTFVMLGRHMPRATDVYVLGDFSSKKELTLLTMGDQVAAEKLPVYAELKKDAEALRAKADAIAGGLTVNFSPDFRTQGPHPFSHPDRKNREARTLALFNTEGN